MRREHAEVDGREGPGPAPGRGAACRPRKAHAGRGGPRQAVGQATGSRVLPGSSSSACAARKPRPRRWRRGAGCLRETQQAAQVIERELRDRLADQAAPWRRRRRRAGARAATGRSRAAARRGKDRAREHAGAAGERLGSRAQHGKASTQADCSARQVVFTKALTWEGFLLSILGLLPPSGIELRNFVDLLGRHRPRHVAHLRRGCRCAARRTRRPSADRTR